MKQLILGGARSGKSRYAETFASGLAGQNNSSLVYIATARAEDDEMAARISHHQASRDKQWQVVEEAIDLALCLDRLRGSHSTVLIDCLTLWLTNTLLDNRWPKARSEFLKSLQQFDNHIIMVSNEVGSGIVPMGELSRRFVDESGWLHQELATICDHVTLVTAGLPLELK